MTLHWLWVTNSLHYVLNPDGSFLNTCKDSDLQIPHAKVLDRSDWYNRRQWKHASFYTLTPLTLWRLSLMGGAQLFSCWGPPGVPRLGCVDGRESPLLRTSSRQPWPWKDKWKRGEVLICIFQRQENIQHTVPLIIMTKGDTLGIGKQCRILKTRQLAYGKNSAQLSIPI